MIKRKHLLYPCAMLFLVKVVLCGQSYLETSPES